MHPLARAFAFVALLAACASRQGSTVGTPLASLRSDSYTCGSTRALRMRTNSTSTTIMIDNDGPFTLPQTTSRAGLTVYSDGFHTVQIYQDQASYSEGRGQLRACVRS